MNERIDELFGKALDQAVPETWTTLNPAQLSKLKDKFAELIVRECVIRAEREWIRNGSDTDHNKAITGVIKSIKEHFGVEE